MPTIGTLPSPVGDTAPVDRAPQSATPPGVGTVTSTAFRFFSPTSIWNTPLLPNAPIDPNSAAITGTLENYINASLANRTGPWINTTSYSTPIYTVPASQPTCPGDHQLRQHPSPGRDGGGAGSRRRPAGGWDRRGDDDLPAVDRHSVGDVADEPVACFRLRPSRPPSARAELWPRARTTTRSRR